MLLAREMHLIKIDKYIFLMDLAIICPIATVKPSRESYADSNQDQLANIFQVYRISQVTGLYAFPCETIATDIYQTTVQIVLKNVQTVP